MTFSLSTQVHGKPLSNLIPDSVEGWTPREPDKIYTPETLYDYIDGGAELYLSYGMKEVISRIIVEGENEIRIEIFDMSEPKNAFGVFTHTRTTDENQYGQGSQYFPGAQIFWKGKYYIALTANDENESIVSAIKDIASDIDAKITSAGEIPAIVNLLPKEGLEPDGFLYFHHYIWLNSYYYISNDNILHIEPDTDAVLAKYGNKIHRYFLLIIKYPDSDSAMLAQNSFTEHFIDPDNTSYCQKIEDGSWLGITTKEEYLIGVFNAGSEESVLDLINSAEKNITKP